MSPSTFDGDRLLFDLKLCSKLMQRFGGRLSVEAIASAATDGLVDQFDCIFARLWVVNADRSALTLVASSGLHTHLDGDFAQVPMGAFKVGKIAQHSIPFLSNRLASEAWVKDRDWVTANSIQGFAGLPLVFEQRVLGVLALFSQAALSAEFLEVLQVMSVAIAGAIAAAQTHQSAAQHSTSVVSKGALSEQLSQALGHREISLIGLEEPLPTAVNQLLLEAAQQFQTVPENYCRLIYEPADIRFEVMLSPEETCFSRLQAQLAPIGRQVEQLNGAFATERDERVAKITIRLPRKETECDLSKREQEVLNLLANGLRDRDIAQQLYISDRTVKFHVKNILTKLSVRTRVQAVFTAARKGWLA